MYIFYRSSCGSLLELRPDQEYCPLKDPDTKYRHEFFSGSLFYPGQTLVGPVNALQNAKWITSTPEIRNSRRCTTVYKQTNKQKTTNRINKFFYHLNFFHLVYCSIC